mmetsp:Transcript_6216/g.7141  ORF Transcript_6216/g.7141 Transcript_6216/m.7141 type:complete len:370 (+) Transcript_6216:269-1378(+)|eukprot:CAMPEP_0184028350 /NCGR_PEP_ID=MMETSP0954-20121128/14776_1 /TAXON_ID=627963 /ORGANISM="Aplanochytrium sp, Strain PBS07" /LENGTH=369 /DNA_ID=CAMNT_0026313153 /DNA_START=426 /DNA_END=1535 /DNA_ORIENTATION=+
MVKAVLNETPQCQLYEIPRTYSEPSIRGTRSSPSEQSITSTFHTISEEEEYESESSGIDSNCDTPPQQFFKRLRLDSESSTGLSSSLTATSTLSSSFGNGCGRRNRSRSVSFSFSNTCPRTPSRTSGRVTSLMMAAREGNVSKVQAVLSSESMVDISAVDKRGFDALMYSVRDGHVEVVRVLLKQLALQNQTFENVKTKYGLTHVLYAALNGHTSCVRLLHKYSNNGKEMLTTSDEYGFTPLMGAARNGHRETVEALLELGADMEQRDRNGLTALFWAVLSKHMDIVSVLVGHGANVNTKERKGKSPLLWAVVKEETTIAQELIGLGAKVCDAVRLYCVMDHIKKSKAKQALNREKPKLNRMVTRVDVQ